MKILIELTIKEAEEYGLLVCTCGYPKNNHFEFGKKVCAHNGECKGYKAMARVGRLIKRKHR